MTAEPGTPRSILAQHARTTRLLGADVMPVRPVEVASPTPDRTDQPADASSKPPAQSQQPSGSQAQALIKLRARYEHEAPHASFGYTFTNIVFGEGDPNARLMFIGEAPGADEDASGRPFVGRAGQLLDKMIGAMGYTRESVYIANILKVRPTNNATPSVSDREASWPYLQEQIDIVAPEAIVTLGLPSTHTVLATDGTMASLRARFHNFTSPAGKTIPVMPTYHPAYLLRSYTPENRGKVWADLTMVVDLLANNS